MKNSKHTKKPGSVPFVEEAKDINELCSEVHSKMRTLSQYPKGYSSTQEWSRPGNFEELKKLYEEQRNKTCLYS